MKNTVILKWLNPDIKKDLKLSIAVDQIMDLDHPVYQDQEKKKKRGTAGTTRTGTKP